MVDRLLQRGSKLSSGGWRPDHWHRRVSAKSISPSDSTSSSGTPLRNQSYISRLPSTREYEPKLATLAVTSSTSAAVSAGFRRATALRNRRAGRSSPGRQASRGRPLRGGSRSSRPLNGGKEGPTKQRDRFACREPRAARREFIAGPAGDRYHSRQLINHVLKELRGRPLGRLQLFWLQKSRHFFRSFSRR